jgi:hypothetical protein
MARVPAERIGVMSLAEKKSAVAIPDPGTPSNASGQQLITIS